jgi:hypothetical protein
MFNFRDFVVFVAGAEFFHMLSHIFIFYYVTLPMNTDVVLVTPELNTWGIAINAAVTVLLLWWSTKLSKKH